MNRTFAPVVLFVYTKLDTTKKTVKALSNNNTASETDLIIFSDGGKDEKSWNKVNKLRSYLKTIKGFKSVKIVERQENYYLERNVIEGITEVVNEYGKVIVLEDDILTSEYFLDYMNDALDKYENESRIMHIVSINFFDMPNDYDITFTAYNGGWGWATWKNRWCQFKHFKSRTEALSGLNEEDIENLEYGGNFKCLHTLDCTPIPWDICWHIEVYKNNGLCVEPSFPMARNIGLYNGTHFNNSRLLGKFKYDKPFFSKKIKKFPPIIEKNDKIEQLCYTSIGAFSFKYNILGKIVRYFYKLIKNHL